MHLDADLELKQHVLDAVTSMDSPVAIDPTTSSSPSSRTSDNRDYVPFAFPLRIAGKADHGATGHSPARDIINLRMPEQKLDRSEVPGAPVDQHCLGPPQRVRAELAQIETDAGDPVLYKPSLLPGR